MWRRPSDEIVYASEILGSTKLRRRYAEEHDSIAFIGEVRSRDAIDVVDQTDHPDDGRGIHRAARTFVVQRDVSASDRRAQLFAGFRHSGDSLAQLIIDLGAPRIAEIE